MDFSKLSEDEIKIIKEKLNKRENEIKEEKKRNEIDKQKHILDKIIESGVIDLIKHARMSCSDTNPMNGYDSSRGYAGCTKCHLLEVIEDHKNGINEFGVLIDITLFKIGE